MRCGVQDANLTREVAAVFDHEELRNMSPQERLRLRQALADLDNTDSRASKVGRGRRRLLLAGLILCCVVLAIWIGVLAMTLPRYYRAGSWRGAWVGFDIGLLVAFAATGWAAWRRRQLLIICLVVVATLLCCDAWFDVVLDARTKGFELSLLSALLVELPLAGLAILLVRRLLRSTYSVLLRSRGYCGPLPGLRTIPLVGMQRERHLMELLTAPDEHLAGADEQPHAEPAGSVAPEHAHAAHLAAEQPRGQDLDHGREER
jgi:hypothetical protein